MRTIGVFLILAFGHSLFADSFEKRVDEFLRAYSFDREDPIIASAQVIGGNHSKNLKFQILKVSTSYGEDFANCLLKNGQTSMVVIYPGLGASRFSDDSQARAELFFKAGQNACVFSNSFETGFYRNHHIVPGDLKGESDFFWQGTLSLIFQLRTMAKTVNFFAVSYGSQILKEILVRAGSDGEWIRKNIHKKFKFGKAIFISPPFKLTDSIRVLDDLWKEKSLNGRLGNIALAKISIDILNYGMKGLPLSREFSEAEYQAFILNIGFYGGVQNIAREFAILANEKAPGKSFTFNDYLEKDYKRYSKREIYSPEFVESWNKIKISSLIFYAEDDYINSPSSIQRFKELSSPAIRVPLSRGSHAGFINRNDVTRLILDFFAE